MSLNLMAIPTVGLALTLAWAGRRLWCISSPPVRGILLCFPAVLSLPCLLMAAYYLRAFEPGAWFYELRNAPASELPAAGIGLIAGIGSGRIGDRKSRAGISRTGISIGCVVFLLAPYVKPVMFAANYSSFRDDWDGSVCRQTTPYSCGPAPAATLIGRGCSELELARECYTSRQGTENWYLARALRQRGLAVWFITGPVPDSPPTSCIAGVRIRQTGHFIAIVRKEGDRYLVGDPMVGEKWYDQASLSNAYDFTGFFMRVLK